MIPQEEFESDMSKEDLPSPSLRKHAENWVRSSQKYVAKKRDLCEKMTEILLSHPDTPQSPPRCLAISDSYYTETLSQLENLTFSDLEHLPMVPQESPKKACSTPSKSRMSPSKIKDQPSPKINAMLRKEYRRIYDSLKTKWEKHFPRKEDPISVMLYKIKEMEYHLKVLEMEAENLDGFLQRDGVTSAHLNRRIVQLASVSLETSKFYETDINCETSYDTKLKKYVHDGLSRIWHTEEQERHRSHSPVAGCSEVQSLHSTKAMEQNPPKTPQRRSSRLVQASSSAIEELQTPTSSKRTPKRSDDYSREKKLETAESKPVETIQAITDKSKDDASLKLSDSTGDSSRDSSSSDVYYDLVEDVELLDSAGDDSEKKDQPKSVVKKSGEKKTGAKPKTASADKELTDDITKTQSPSKSKHDSTKTGFKIKEFVNKNTPTKSKCGYTKVPQTDTDED